MTSKLEIVAGAHALKDVLNEHASQYHHSRTLIEQRTAILLKDQKLKHIVTVSYGIKDLFLIGALTHSSMLLTGDTDLGKTTLAKLILNSLFGEEEKGWHKIDIDIESGKDLVVETHLDAIVRGETSDELYTINRALLLPGLITDELNRGHSKVVNSVMHIFDRDITMPNGKRAKLGHEYEPGKRYQFQIAAINEGEDYTGTFEIDKALRRRTIIEIPMNVFTPTPDDRHQLAESKEIVFGNTTNHFNEVLAVYRGLGQIKLHENAQLFIAFMEAFDYCEHSLNKEKRSVPDKGGSIYHICTKPIHGTDVVCRFIKSFDNELCPYVRGISPGISRNLVAVARGLAVLRAVKFAEFLNTWITNGATLPPPHADLLSILQEYTGTSHHGSDLAKLAFSKYVAELEVLPDDVEAVFGFVAYSKVGLASPWVVKHYQGNRFEAVRAFVAQAKEKFEEGAALRENLDVHGLIGSGLKDNHQWTAFDQYCTRENPWFWRAIEPHRNPRPNSATSRVQMEYLYQE